MSAALAVEPHTGLRPSRASRPDATMGSQVLRCVTSHCVTDCNSVTAYTLMELSADDQPEMPVPGC